MKFYINERGELNSLLIPVIFLSLLFIGTAAFAVWAFSGRQTYKNNVDAQISAAKSDYLKVVQAQDAAQFAQAAKQPLKTYTGPEAYGSVRLSYPKTWSAYVVASGDGSTPLDAYFNPDVVPDITSDSSTFALRVQVSPQTYDQAVSFYSAGLQQGNVTITPYRLPKIPNVVGIRVDGQIDTNKQGSVIVLPVRDKTLKIWTESNTYLSDFNNNILPNFTFSP